jgi:hypothetical protein
MIKWEELGSQLSLINYKIECVIWGGIRSTADTRGKLQ